MQTRPNCKKKKLLCVFCMGKFKEKDQNVFVMLIYCEMPATT